MELKHYAKFFEEIKSQFVYGGQKYAHSKQKESTDCLFDDFGKNWLFGTLAKYCKRYSNLARERDLLKIACYCYIIWLKRGLHINKEGTKKIINTTVGIKSKYFNKFNQKIFNFMEDYIISEYNTKLALLVIYSFLVLFANDKFENVKETELFTIFALCYYVWERDIPDNKKGKDQDVYNERKD